MAEYTPSRFLVLKNFVLLRAREGATLDDGSPEYRNLPVLGIYQEGHEYALTTVNIAAAKRAADDGLARLI